MKCEVRGTKGAMESCCIVTWLQRYKVTLRGNDEGQMTKEIRMTNVE